MRFRQQFGLTGFFWLIMLCFWLALLFRAVHHSHDLLGAAIVFTLLATLQLLQKLFIYWEVGPGELLEHRYWSTWRISWNEITRVAPRSPKHPASLPIEIQYARTGPLSDRGQILASPADRDAFVAPLRKFAPHADFEL